ncbi:CubicO group peptidase, beta-lactamase class C family [Tenacibaculum sp. 190130A14a]|uniref:D-alanyl-D-alanine carboxypeptidase n=1 Tax=Tenacibaculum polynesiense TaxID=3137857 RepID=A0ABM9PDJ8_9FLAO
MNSSKLITLILLLLLQQIASAQQSLTQLTEKYTPYLKELNQDITILTSTKGKTAVANIGKRNFNEHTVFNIGSATKKMTAILILQEAEKGNLKLSDSIGTYLQAIQNVDNSLTIEALLRHRSGLGEIVGRNYTEEYFAKSDSAYNQNILNRIPAGNLEKVGKYQYCNTNYILLGKILEKVADKSYFDLLEERIFQPANMQESYPYLSKSLNNLAPPTHRGKDVSKFLDHRFFSNYAYAAGSVASTLHDMQLFYNHLFEKKTLLSENSLKLLTSFDDANYGLGMIQFKDGYIGHGGNNLGYAYREYYNPQEKKLILCFSNGEIIPFNKILKKELFDYINGKPSTISFSKNITSQFKGALGKYQFDTHGMKMQMEIIEKNNHIYFLTQGAQVILVSKEENKLYNGSFGIELEVNPQKNDELIFRQNGLETTIKRINP